MQHEPSREVQADEDKRCQSIGQPKIHPCPELLENEAAKWDLLEKTYAERRAEYAIPSDVAPYIMRPAKSQERNSQQRR